MDYDKLSVEEEMIGSAIVDAAFKVHRALGPGLVERIYEIWMVHELQKAGFVVQRQVEVAIEYDGIVFKDGLRMDILVNNLVIVELKAVDQVNLVWQTQLLSQMKLAKRRLGYLINFHVSQIKNGIRRMIL